MLSQDDAVLAIYELRRTERRKIRNFRRYFVGILDRYHPNRSSVSAGPSTNTASKNKNDKETNSNTNTDIDETASTCISDSSPEKQGDTSHTTKKRKGPSLTPLKVSPLDGLVSQSGLLKTTSCIGEMNLEDAAATTTSSTEKNVTELEIRKSYVSRNLKTRYIPRRVKL